MYQYKYVKAFVGGGWFIDNSECSHREVIEQHAAEGWRFVGSIPTKFTSNGSLKELDLIFEKEV